MPDCLFVSLTYWLRDCASVRHAVVLFTLVVVVMVALFTYCLKKRGGETKTIV